MLKKKSLLLGCALLAVVAAAVGFFWPFGNDGKILRLPGIVEIQEVRLGSKVGGRVKQVISKSGSENNGSNLEGQVVEAGQPLVIFDVPELEAQRDQARAREQAAKADYEKARKGLPLEVEVARATMESSRARYQKMKAGPRPEEKEQAKSQLDTAEAELKQAIEDYERIRKLYLQQSIARVELDAALSARDRAQGRVNAARAWAKLNDKYRTEDIAEAKAEWDKTDAKWKELKSTLPEEIALAKARWDESKAKLDELEINLKEAVVSAPKNGRVEVISVRTGDLIPPNQPIVRMLYLEDLWVKAYVPETELHKVTHGQKAEVLRGHQVEVLIDNSTRRFKGTVYYISPISEFTPRNVQSVDERHHQVFAIKIRVDNAEGVFHSGMAAEVLLPVQEP